MTIDEVDGFFASESTESPKKLEQPNHQARLTEYGHSISFAEWHWRMTDRIFDEDRKKRGLRPISAKVRKAQLEAYLASITKVDHETANQETEEEQTRRIDFEFHS